MGQSGPWTVGNVPGHLWLGRLCGRRLQSLKFSSESLVTSSRCCCNWCNRCSSSPNYNMYNKFYKFIYRHNGSCWQIRTGERKNQYSFSSPFAFRIFCRSQSSCKPHPWEVSNTHLPWIQSLHWDRLPALTLEFWLSSWNFGMWICHLVSFPCKTLLITASKFQKELMLDHLQWKNSTGDEDPPKHSLWLY